jgi:hypothetical protein
MVGGAVVGAKGIDNVQAGFRQFGTGKEVDSLATQSLEAMGMSPNAAKLTDAGIDIVGTAGAGIATKPIALANIIAKEPALTQGMRGKEILDTWEVGSKALINSEFEALGGTATSALTKAPYIGQGVDAAGNALTTTWWQEVAKGTWLYLKGTGFTPNAAAVAGPVAAGLNATAAVGNWSEHSSQPRNTDKEDDAGSDEDEKD